MLQLECCFYKRKFGNILNVLEILCLNDLLEWNNISNKKFSLSESEVRNIHSQAY